MDYGGCYYQNDETPNCASRDCAVATSTRLLAKQSTQNMNPGVHLQ